MRKRKQFFGARRRWPDSPRIQKLQVTWDIEAYSGAGNEDYYILQHLQGLEVDLMKGLSTMEIPAGWLKTGIPLGGLRRGDFYAFSTPCAKHDHLQRMFNNGLQGKLMFCLEESDEMRTARLRAQAHIWPEFPKGLLDDSYVTHHHRPYHEFDKILVETPDAVVHTPNW